MIEKYLRLKKGCRLTQKYWKIGTHEHNCASFWLARHYVELWEWMKGCNENKNI